MAKLSLIKGTTSYSAYVFVQDSSVSTGAGLTGLAFNTAGLVASYVRPRAARQAIALVTQTATGAYSAGGFVEVDSVNMPGLYRLDVPDAALAAGANAVVIMLQGATHMAPVVLEIELTAVNNQDATAFGLGSLDAAVSSRLASGSYTAPDNTAIAAIQAKTDNLPNSPAGVSDIPSASANADALLDRADAIETGLTPRQALRLLASALAGKLSGAATTTITIRNTADSKTRITATVDSDGNRSAVTYDVS